MEGSQKWEGLHMGYQDPRVFHFPNGVWQGGSQEKSKRNHVDMLQEFQGDIVQEFCPQNKELDFDGGQFSKQKDF